MTLIPPEVLKLLKDGFEIRKFFELVHSFGHGKAIGLEFSDCGEGWVELEMEGRPELVGVPEENIISSGAMISLVDTCAGSALWHKLGKFEPIVTVDLRLDYLRPAFAGETLYARCECYKMTRSIAFVRGIVHTGERDRPVAHVAGTFMRHP
ncbi:PaaI family thioesterase [Sphingomicrobium nitratireducens]|uniref:PaaI family thioesterase n=1 Tax=Sphingomicrobium nitratireducens TaxID=2964666 RepID=UPI00224050A3|nr:PaaI family thioesterase [Sphingomicrobium nitratireducens]